MIAGVEKEKKIVQQILYQYLMRAIVIVTPLLDTPGIREIA